jgi:alanine racemase
VRTRLIGVQRLQAGDTVGYGSIYTAAEPLCVGIAACGYADGYPRSAPGANERGTPVLVNGAPAPIIGRVSMVVMTSALRGPPDARPGDPVVLWGDDLPVETIASAAGTIGYEPVCSITRRVRFVED